jgi:hypothetical protein
MRGLVIAGGFALFFLITVGVPSALWLFFRFVARRADRRVLARPPAAVGDPGRVAPVLICCAVLGPLTAVSSALLGTTVSWLAAAIGFLLQVSAWVVHGLPGHSRNLKYALFFAGATVVEIAFSGGRRFSAPALAITAVIGVANVVVAVVCIAALRPDAPLVPGDASSRRAFRAYRVVTWIQGPDVLSMLAMLVLSVFQLGIPYVFVRWCAGARVHRRALLYLRSFHDEEAGRVFARVITPALHRNVSVTGLVHVAQPTSALSRDVPLLWRSRLVAIADDNWRTWVENHLESALAVVVDVSVATESVAWELERARAILPPERVLVLHRKTSSVAVDPQSIGYQLATSADVDQARASVSAWLGRALAGVDPALAPRRPRVSSPRRQLPILPLLILSFVLPLLATLAASGVARYRERSRRAMSKVQIDAGAGLGRRTTGAPSVSHATLRPRELPLP